MYFPAQKHEVLQRGVGANGANAAQLYGAKMPMPIFGSPTFVEFAMH